MSGHAAYAEQGIPLGPVAESLTFLLIAINRLFWGVGLKLNWQEDQHSCFYTIEAITWQPQSHKLFWDTQEPNVQKERIELVWEWKQYCYCPLYPWS